MTQEDITMQDIKMDTTAQSNDSAVIDPRDLDTASQGRLIWLKFRKHKLAMTGGIVVLLLFFIALFVEFFSPLDPHEFNSKKIYHPRQKTPIILL